MTTRIPDDAVIALTVNLDGLVVAIESVRKHQPDEERWADEQLGHSTTYLTEQDLEQMGYERARVC